MSRVDLIGQTFNRLTVVKLSDKKKEQLTYGNVNVLVGIKILYMLLHIN